MKNQKQSYGHIVSIRLKEDQVTKLRQMRDLGVSASFVVRQALEKRFETLKNGGYIRGRNND